MRTALVAIVSLLLSGPSVAAPVPCPRPGRARGRDGLDGTDARPGGYWPRSTATSSTPSGTDQPVRAGQPRAGVRHRQGCAGPLDRRRRGGVRRSGRSAWVVTVEHPDGLRSSLTDLATIESPGGVSRRATFWGRPDSGCIWASGAAMSTSIPRACSGRDPAAARRARPAPMMGQPSARLAGVGGSRRVRGRGRDTTTLAGRPDSRRS